MDQRRDQEPARRIDRPNRRSAGTVHQRSQLSARSAAMPWFANQCAAQIKDLISQRRGFFRTSSGLGGFLHLVFQFVNHILQLFGRQTLASLCQSSALHRASCWIAAHAVGEILDIFYDLLRLRCHAPGYRLLVWRGGGGRFRRLRRTMAGGHFIGVHDDRAFKMPRCPANGLNQRRFAAQEASFVGVQHRHQRHFWQVQPFRAAG